MIILRGSGVTDGASFGSFLLTGKVTVEAMAENFEHKVESNNGLSFSAPSEISGFFSITIIRDIRYINILNTGLIVSLVNRI